MSSLSFSDLGRSFAFKNHGASLRAQLTQLTGALSSGRNPDPVAQLGGDTAALRGAQYRMMQVEAARLVNRESAILFETAGLRVDQILEETESFLNEVRTANSEIIDANTSGLASSARRTLDAIFDHLNGSVGGRHLLAGSATDRPPMIGTDELIAELETMFDAAPDQEEGLDRINAWFDASGGFTAAVYRGSEQDLTVSDGSGPLAPLPRAADPAFRSVIRDLSLIALSRDRPGIPIDGPASILEAASQRLSDAQTDILALRVQLGANEERIDTSGARLAAESTSLSLTISSLTMADPFETASALEEVQIRLQSLYAVTARTSQLSLLNFLS